MEKEKIITSYSQLYDKILDSNNSRYYSLLKNITKAMLQDVLEYKTDTAIEYLNKLESINWYNYLSKKESSNIIEGMKPEKGWDIAEWESTLDTLNLPSEDVPYYNKWALYTTMNMVYSDSVDTILKIMGKTKEAVPQEELFKAIYLLSLDKLKDEDRVFNIRSYFSV